MIKYMICHKINIQQGNVKDNFYWIDNGRNLGNVEKKKKTCFYEIFLSYDGMIYISMIIGVRNFK